MGTCKNRLGEAVLTGTHNLCFEQKCINIRNFLSENFHFLVVKISVYLNKHVFVMYLNYDKVRGDFLGPAHAACHQLQLD